MARAGRRFARGGSRPNRGWSGQITTGFAAVATGTKVLISGLTPANDGIDLTILRTVGVLSISSDQSGSAEQQIGAFGIMLVRDQAFAAGAASIPSPVTNLSDDDWFVYQPFCQQSEVAITSPSSVQYHFDSKAKRIVPGTGVTIAMMIANASSIHVLEFALAFRMLVQVRGTR